MVRDGIVSVTEALNYLDLLATHEHDTDVIHLSGGLTNDNVLITFAQPRNQINKVVLRRFSEITTRHLRYDRRSEYTNACLAAELGISPDVLGAIPARDGIHGGALAIRFVEGRALEEKTGMATLCSSDVLIEPLLDVLHRLHRDCTAFTNAFDIIAARSLYEEDVAKLSGRPITWPGYADVVRKLGPIETRLREIDEARVPCHNDMLAGNFISTASQSLVLIDFELSGMAPASWELGNLISENSLDQDEAAVERLIKLYWLKSKVTHGQSADPAPLWLASRIARAKAWSLISKVSWSAWGHVLHDIKYDRESDVFNYEAWSLERLRAAEATLNDDNTMAELLQNLHRDELDI